MFFSLRKRSRLSVGQARHPRRPLSLEGLEDRTLLSLTTGTILVATSPSVQNQSTFANLDQEVAGLVAVDSKGNQSAFSTRQGLMCTPVAVTTDTNGNFFVADQTAFGPSAGGIIEVNSNTHAQSVVAAQGTGTTYLFGPAGIVYLKGYLYVISSGNAGWGITGTSPRPPDLVRIDPTATAADAAMNTNQMLMYGPLIYDTSIPPQYQPQDNLFRNPTGITTDGGNHIYVVDAGASGRPLEPDVPPKIWDFQADSNGNFVPGQAPSALTTGNYLNDPVGIVMDTYNGNLIVLNQNGSLVQVDPSGGQTIYTTLNLGQNVNANSLTVGNDGTIYVDALNSVTGAVTVWSILNTTPATPMSLSVPSDYLSLAEGMMVGNDGSLYIASSPAPVMTPDQAGTLSMSGSMMFPTGIIHMTVSGGSLNIAPDSTAMARTPGLFCLPQDVVEDSHGTLYVADETALEHGAIITVDPTTKQARLLAWGQSLNDPTGITFVNNELYVINSGDSSGVVHSLVQVDPHSGTQSIVNNLPNPSGGFLKVLSGIAPYYFYCAS